MENIQGKGFTVEELEQFRIGFEKIFKPVKDFLSVEELAEYLGLSKSAVYKITSKKEIPHYNPGGKKIYFKRTEVNTWIESSRVASDIEVLENLDNRIYNSDHKVKW
ncbi:helix-turn-helix domain-containing protein [Patiriisocius sp. Uisw_017]|uniref:helix-turn-helix domain-containing protein n=1 Tax=Patiriisocius sp. Uisw_017 TaxID=3230968 RepID=UPI0039E87424